ncbi:hypothetical protein HPB49_012713 [Dermacentor silvarum]|uniref:Uncharacterized protein n=1 Tax=Dermacentor silvarum TaxID=543639 RepID=A0ACB8C9H0_DERSI|nr:hypothetical protein HPB49_012713 [Dermacentor silvarum]
MRLAQLSNTLGIMEAIVVSAVPTVEDQPFPRVGLLYAYTFKGIESSFNCFSAMILLFGAVGRIKPALTVFLYWNVFSTITCMPLNIGLFHTKSGDEPYSLDLTSIARFFSQLATVEYFYARMAITIIAALVKGYVLFVYIGFYRDLHDVPYNYMLQE